MSSQLSGKPQPSIFMKSVLQKSGMLQKLLDTVIAISFPEQVTMPVRWATLHLQGMIFIPCEGGLSHDEAENTTPEQVAAGADVLLNAVAENAGYLQT